MSYDDVMGGSDYSGDGSDFDPLEDEMEGMHFDDEDSDDPDNDFH